MLGTALLRAHWRPLSMVAVLIAAGGVAAWYLRAAEETYGVISVDSPQVYTRERLVNDRFTEEAWLRQQLDWTQQLLDDKRFDAPEAKISSTFDAFVDLLVSMKAPGVGEDNTAASAVQWPAALQTLQELEKASGIEQDPTDTFKRARNYRDAIRADLLQTQLDDRHDIGGNTLYRLTFDASIVPGSNTHRAAEILVALAPLDYDNPKEVDSETDNDPSLILDSAYESLYLDWQKYLQITVTNAIEAQTDEFFATGTLAGVDGVALQGFLVNQSMDASDGIDFFRQVPANGEKNTLDDGEKQARLQNLIYRFKDSYTEKLQQDEAERFAKGVLRVVQGSGVELSIDQLPTQLCQIIQPRLRKTSLCPDIESFGDPRDALSSAVQYAEGECNRLKTGSFSAGYLEFPCPRTVSIEGTSFVELVLLRQMRFVRNFTSEMASKEASKPLCEFLYPNPLGCTADGSVQDRAPTRNLFRIDKTFVRRVLVEYVRAKLNNEVAVVRVEKPVEEFFDVDEQGCGYGSCNLVFRPNDVKLKSFKDALKRQVGMIFTYALDPSSKARPEDVESSDQALLRGEAGGRAGGAGTGGAGRLGGGLRVSQGLEMRHQDVQVVGFERPPAEAAKAEFGWVIRAGRGSGEGGPFDRKRQEPLHHQLSAVVSIPSWWRALSVTVHTAWLEDGEDPRAAADPDTAARSCKNQPPFQTCSAFEVFLPGSVAEVSELFRYEVRTEPYIDARALDTLGPQGLEVGRKGLIVLEGGRLWRGTIVTVGHLKADKITVLPDMKGVIAEFKCVEPPPGLGYAFPSDKPPPTPNVVVWTSEGRTTTPYHIQLEPYKPRSAEDTPCKDPER